MCTLPESSSQSLESDIISLNSAAGQGDLQAMKKLLERGADVNTCDYDGRTPLHVVIRKQEFCSVFIGTFRISRQQLKVT